MDQVCRRIRIKLRRVWLHHPRLVVACGLIFVIWILSLRHGNNQKPKNVNIYVVEEHHEVLQYWYREANIHNLQKSRNTLAAGLIGLIDRMIWISPSWDKTLQHEGYQKYELTMGYRLKKGKITKQFCQCHILYEGTGNRVKKKDCMYNAVFDDEYDGDFIAMDNRLCHVVRSFFLEKVNEDSALEFLGSQDWTDSRPVMLDIDEDFFGCESGYDDLSKAKLTYELVAELSVTVNKVMCPNSGREEADADRLLKEFLAEYIKLCDLSTWNEQCNKDTKRFRNVLHQRIKLSFDEHHTMFCAGTAAEVTSAMDQIFPTLRKLNLLQLRAVVHLGFCLATSPATLGFSRQKLYTLCTGANMPNDTVVTWYTPGMAEVASRMDDLYKILDRVMKFDTKVVTVARSVRDGYTPRHLANSIEDGILKYFQDNKGTHRWAHNIIYDDDLLGGKAAWEGRHKPQIV